MKLSFLVPKQPIFFELFIKLGKDVKNIAAILKELCSTEDNSKLIAFANQAEEIEHNADEATHEIVERLNKTFVTPFDREDIYSLTEELDDIIDRTENVIHNIVIYKVDPKETFLGKFAEIIYEDAEQIVQLTELLQSQKYSTIFRDLIIKIHTLEDKGDQLFLETMTSLFNNSLDAMTVIKLKDIAEDLEKVVDKFQDASNTFESILVKSL